MKQKLFIASAVLLLTLVVSQTANAATPATSTALTQAEDTGFIVPFFSVNDDGTAAIGTTPTKPLSIIEKLDRERRLRLAAYSNRLARRIDALAEYYQGLLERMLVKVVAIETEGGDTYAASAHINGAADNIAEARSALNRAMEIGKAESFEITKMQKFSDIRDALEDGAGKLKSTYDNIRSGIEELTISEKDLEASKPVTTPTTATKKK